MLTPNKMPCFFISTKAEALPNPVAAINLDLVATIQKTEGRHPIAGRGVFYGLLFSNVDRSEITFFAYNSVQDRDSDFSEIILKYSR